MHSLLAFNLPDGIILILLAAFVVAGVIRGFSRTLIAMCGTLVALLLAGLLCSSFSGFLADKFHLLAKLSDKIRAFLPKLGSIYLTDLGGTSLDASLPEIAIAKFLKKALLSLGIAKDTLPPGTTLADVLAPVFANYALLAISFAGLFILFRLAFFVLSLLLRNIRRLPVIGKIDRILGAVLGAAQALVVVFAVLALIYVLPANWLKKTHNAIDNSAIARPLAEHNLLVNVLTGRLSKGRIEDVILGKDGDESPSAPETTEEDEAAAVYGADGTAYRIV